MAPYSERNPKFFKENPTAESVPGDKNTRFNDEPRSGSNKENETNSKS